jgi:hypothetical protein
MFLWSNIWTEIRQYNTLFNPLNAQLNPIRHLLALEWARDTVHVSRIRVKHPMRTPILRTLVDTQHASTDLWVILRGKNLQDEFSKF